MSFKKFIKENIAQNVSKWIWDHFEELFFPIVIQIHNFSELFNSLVSHNVVKLFDLFYKFFTLQLESAYTIDTKRSRQSSYHVYSIDYFESNF